MWVQVSPFRCNRRRPRVMSSVPHSLSCPLLGSSCVTGRSGRLDGHGPPEQEHAGVWTANPPGVTGQCGAHAGVCVCVRVCVCVTGGAWRENAKWENKAEGWVKKKKSSLFRTWQPSQKKPSHVSSASDYTHTQTHTLLTTLPIDVKCHNFGCCDRLLSLICW